MSEPLPRSALVPGVLGGLSVIATTLLLELGRTLVLNSFGESDGVRLLSTGLRWLAVLLVVLAVLYAGYRFTMDRRSRTRRARRRNALAALDGACPFGPVDVRVVAPPTAEAMNPGWRNEVVAALRELPVWNYDTATLHAVLGAVAAAHGASPGPLPAPATGTRETSPEDPRPAQPLGDPHTGPGLREWLEYGRILKRQGDHHLLVEVPEAPEKDEVRAGELWQAALFALLSHCADQASRWAVALTTVPFAPGARRWFTMEENYLRELVVWCSPPAATQGRTPVGHPGPEIPPATVVQLVRIADALDTWYAHQVRIRDDKTAVVAENLGRLTVQTEMTWYSRSMELRQPRPHDPRSGRHPVRAGTGAREQRVQTPGGPAYPGQARRQVPPEPADPPCGIRRRATGLAARWKHRAALERLNAAGTPGDLEAAVQLLRAAWWRLPREDVGNQVRVLTNLAVAHIEQGRLDAAADRLELAAVRAAGEEDDAGRALVHELNGAVCWARGEPRGALRHWQRALTLYDDLADDRGIAGCLHHMGSALRVVPEHADLVLGDDPPPITEDVYRCAQDWMDEAAARRAGTLAPHFDRRPLRAGEAGDARLDVVDR
ncbi:tetratricopeptide repeat protein [Nocardia speluncae]|uniref:Tetratricopeptide repeat protein n=1 Tax=Nocardia speluncae TaxID=419477 RepID=A0A846XAJ4_9NOCA|nr:tetratricopeptide repeat protein [Nocardia speluncae]NKY32089.1 tetratricopeptide repeat protein [Nocardia speluncae]